jgi:transcriptional regulator with XRE-family HTH domain
MPIINQDTYEQRKKRLNFTAKAIADEAGVTEATVGNIKKGKNLRVHSVKKIAGVLKCTIEQLTSPPDETFKIDREESDYLCAASIMYNVPENWIVRHAALFFTILAQQSLKQRGEKAVKLRNDFEALDDEILSRDEFTTWDGAKYEYLHSIEKELMAIGQGDLSGPKDEEKNQNAHFVNFLIELQDTAGFEIQDASGFYEQDGWELSGLTYHLSVFDDALDKMLPEVICYDDTDKVIHRSQHLAKKIIDEYGLIQDVPKSLRNSKRANDLVKWTFEWIVERYNNELLENQEKRPDERRLAAKKRYNDFFTWAAQWAVVDATEFFFESDHPDKIATYVIPTYEKTPNRDANKDSNFMENSNA